MSFGLKALFITVLTLTLGLWLLRAPAREFILTHAGQIIGLKVEAPHLTLTFTNHGLAVKLRNVQLEDPKSHATEHVSAVALAISVPNLSIHILVDGLA